MISTYGTKGAFINILFYDQHLLSVRKSYEKNIYQRFFVERYMNALQTKKYFFLKIPCSEISTRLLAGAGFESQRSYWH